MSLLLTDPEAALANAGGTVPVFRATYVYTGQETDSLAMSTPGVAGTPVVATAAAALPTDGTLPGKGSKIKPMDGGPAVGREGGTAISSELVVHYPCYTRFSWAFQN